MDSYEAYLVKQIERLSKVDFKNGTIMESSYTEGMINGLKVCLDVYQACVTFQTGAKVEGLVEKDQRSTLV